MYFKNVVYEINNQYVLASRESDMFGNTIPLIAMAHVSSLSTAMVPSICIHISEATFTGLLVKLNTLR